MWPWFFTSPPPAGESSSLREPCLLRSISLKLPAYGLCKVSFCTHLWAKKDRNSHLQHERLHLCGYGKKTKKTATVPTLNCFAALNLKLRNNLHSLRMWVWTRCKPCPPFVTSRMEKVNSIRWPLNSKFVLIQLLPPWPVVKPVTADRGRAANLPHTKLLVFCLNLAASLLPFIHLFRNISHLSIYPHPAPPYTTTSGLIMGKL